MVAVLDVERHWRQRRTREAIALAAPRFNQGRSMKEATGKELSDKRATAIKQRGEYITQNRIEVGSWVVVSGKENSKKFLVSGVTKENFLLLNGATGQHTPINFVLAA